MRGWVGAEVCVGVCGGWGVGDPIWGWGGADVVVGGVRPRSLLHLPRTQCHVVV